MHTIRANSPLMSDANTSAPATARRRFYTFATNRHGTSSRADARAGAPETEIAASPKRFQHMYLRFAKSSLFHLVHPPDPK